MKLFEPSLVPTCVGFLFKILLAILVTASCGHVLQDGDASSLILLLQLFVVVFLVSYICHHCKCCATLKCVDRLAAITELAVA